MEICQLKDQQGALLAFQQQSNDENESDEAFMRRYRALLRGLQHDLGDMHPTPIVSMSAYQVERRQRWHDGRLQTETETANCAYCPPPAQTTPEQGEQHGR